MTTSWVCVDCLMLFANGETPSELDEDERDAWLARIEHYCGECQVAVGGDCHADDCDAAETGWDCECETRDFSWSSCHTRGSTLGGSRHAVTLFPIGEGVTR